MGPRLGAGTDKIRDAGSVSPRRPETDAFTSARMSRQARRDTSPELALRRELHRRGLRYRIEYPIPGIPRRRADIAFTRARVAVFVDGCFWHACPRHGTWPKRNDSWWAAKLEANVARDAQTDNHLAAVGWSVVRIWEHEAAVDAADRVQAAVNGGPPGSFAIPIA